MPTPDRSSPSTFADLAHLGRLFERFRPPLLAMLERRIDPALRRRIDPDQILQESFLDASRKWPAYQRGSPMTPYAWLYGLARDRLIQEVRHHQRDKRNPRQEMAWPEQSSIMLGLRLMGAGPSPSQHAVAEETARRIHEALGLLGETDREILSMRYFDDLKSREVAEILGLTENAVYQREFRALKKLRAIMAADDARKDSP